MALAPALDPSFVLTIFGTLYGVTQPLEPLLSLAATENYTR